MASINDVDHSVNKVNTTLHKEITATKDLKTSVDSLDTDTKTLDQDVKKLDNDVNAGFAATLNALNVLAQIDTAVAQLLFHLTQQADTMICALEHISQNTCGILTQVTLQTQLQTRIRDDADAILSIAEFSNPAAALERQRLAELRAEIEVCCPQPTPDPACTYRPCPSPQPVSMPNLPKLPNPGRDNQPPR